MTFHQSFAFTHFSTMVSSVFHGQNEFHPVWKESSGEKQRELHRTSLHTAGVVSSAGFLTKKYRGAAIM